MNALRQLVRYAGMPLLLGLAGFCTFAALDAGIPGFVVVSSTSVTLFFTLLALERFVPYRPEWSQPDGQRRHDVGHLLIGTMGGGQLGHMLTFGGLGLVAAWLAERVDGSLWPRAWPLIVQIVLLFLLADLGRYVQHRLMHSVDWLWRFHQLHHSTGRLSVLKATRNHIVERVTQQPFLFGPAILLGAPPEAILPFVVLNSYLGAFDHSNIDFRLGVLERVVMGPMAHRLHHSRDPSESRSNFGTALVVWDRLFGTYTDPLRREMQRQKVDVGIEGDDTPAGFWEQIVDPFRLGRRMGSARQPGPAAEQLAPRDGS